MDRLSRIINFHRLPKGTAGESGGTASDFRPHLIPNTNPQMKRFALLLLMASCSAVVGSTPGAGPTSDNSLLVENVVRIPPPDKAGQWLVLKKDPKAGHTLQWFLFRIGNTAPVLETYVLSDDKGEADPESDFSRGFAEGYLSSFCNKAGFTFTPLQFGKIQIKGKTALKAVSQLKKGTISLYFACYILGTMGSDPQIVILSIRKDSDVETKMESFLSGLDWLPKKQP
jgi:hypothetical protein